MNTTTNIASPVPTRLQRHSYKPLRVSETIRVTGLRRTSFDLCSISVVPEGCSGRDGGPEVPGPWGFATTHALVIDNEGGSARERALCKLTFHVGEPFEVEGLPGVWTFESPRPDRLDGDGPRLVEAIAGELRGGPADAGARRASRDVGGSWSPGADSDTP